MRQIAIFILSLFIITGNFSVLAQNESSSVRFKAYSTTDGLSHNYVYSIVKDQKGFMWFGTLKGLNRFDGYEFKVYTSNNIDFSLTHNTVTSLVDLQDGNLLVATNAGLYYFNTKIERFYSFFHDSSKVNSLIGDHVFTIVKDNYGGVWAGTSNGLCQVIIQKDKKDPKLTFQVNSLVKKLNETINYDNVVEIIQDSNDNFWVGTTMHGVFKLDTKNNELKQFLFTDAFGNPNNTISGFAEYEGEIWVANIFGAHTIDMKTESVKAYFIDQGFTNASVKYILHDTKGRLWFATYEGVYRYIKKTDTFINYRYNPDNPYSLNNDYIRCLYDDGEGRIWIGTERGGVNVLDENVKPFKSIHPQTDDNSVSGGVINSVLTANEDVVWIGTSGDGVYAYDRKNNTSTHYLNDPLQPNSITGNFISSLFIDQSDQVWVGTWGFGLNKMNVSEKGEVNFTREALGYDYIICFIEDKYNRLWVSTSEGVLIRNNSTGKFHRVNIPQSPDGIIHFLGDLATDSYGNVYSPSLNDGLFIIRCVPDFEEQINLSIDNVLCFNYTRNDTSSLPPNLLTAYVDQANTIWVGSRGNGLIKITTDGEDIFNIDNVRIEQFSERDGLSDDIVMRILEDGKNNLWLSTSNGLSKFNSKDETFINYYEEDGLTTNEFFWFAADKNESGEMFFGSTKGLIYFHPDSIQVDTTKPKIILTDLHIMNKPIKPGEQYGDYNYSVLDKSISYVSQITLSPKDYFFSIAFSSTNYTSPQNNRFAYKLEGFNTDWIYTDANQRTAYFTNIHGGDYVFKVKSANSDGVWNETPYSLKIKVNPPFTQTVWFKLILILAIISSVVFFYRIRISRLKKHAFLLEKNVKERTQQLKVANDKLTDKNEEINTQNEVLANQKNKLEEVNMKLGKYQEGLEQLVEKRTDELIKAKEKAEESDRLKSSFLANMSHEIRTPLNALLGFSGLIAERSYSDADRKKMNETIQSCGEDLQQLITNLIDISIIESKQLEIHTELLDPKEYLTNLFNEFRLTYFESKSQYGIEFVLDIDSSVDNVLLKTDPYRLKQVFEQLVSNALKFTSSGFIKLGYTLTPEKDYLKFYVKDSGIGIKSDALNEIFKRFRKVEEQGGDVYRGAGLGLAISSNLVAKLEGTITAESTLGKGSTFSFTIPIEKQVSKDQKVVPKVHKLPTSQPHWKGKKILVAEDEESNFFYLSTILKDTKLTIDWVKNGQEAVDALLKNPNDYSLVLMDIRMPGMSGAEASKLIKKSNTIPIIAQTAYSSPNEIHEFIQFGFDDFLSKPIKREMLLNALGKYLG